MHTAEMDAVRIADLEVGETFGSGPVQVPLSAGRTALLVALGGALGAMLRFVLVMAMPTVTTPTLVDLPWSTFTANVLGSLGLGALVGVLEVRRGRPWMRPLLGTGVCGGFTTMSAVVLEGSAMIGAEFPIFALGYALLTVVTCIVAVVAGLLGARRLARPGDERPARPGAEENDR